ncbi:MAG: TetR/AcrR family transcriptional regulator [Alphaproteobacteria bacterium]|nr:TetR/AcrR family transcriptional regulator [Alphaproteobacteria bacterium]
MTETTVSRYPQTKVSHEDWLNAALAVLIDEGVERVKIQDLARTLDVSRSSFYWYFKSRQDLLDQMLWRWLDTNTAAIVERAARPADSIVQAVLHVFECWTDDAVFDPRLDFAVREWARRSEAVRRVLDDADAARVEAIRRMFARHGYEATDAFVRARILYFMQIGYYALDLGEPMETRLSYVEAYVRGFTGVEPTTEEAAAFRAFASAVVPDDHSGA